MKMMMDWGVRQAVAIRIPSKYLGGMLLRETVPKVIEILQERLTRLGDSRPQIISHSPRL